MTKSIVFSSTILERYGRRPMMVSIDSIAPPALFTLIKCRRGVDAARVMCQSRRIRQGDCGSVPHSPAYIDSILVLASLQSIVPTRGNHRDCGTIRYLTCMSIRPTSFGRPHSLD